MKACLLIALFLPLHTAYSQKVIRKTLSNPAIRFYHIDSGNCFLVDLATSPSGEMAVEATMEGEYGKDLILQVHEEGNTATILAGFPRGFISPKDKLSAHKVVSIALRITLPAFKEALVSGTSSNVHVTGAYKNLRVVLSDGHCILKNVKEQVEVITQSGDIELMDTRGEITAISKFGKVDRYRAVPGDARVILNSTLGNIHITNPD